MTTKIVKLFNKMNRRGSGANLNLFRSATVVLVLLLGVGNAWAGGGGSSNYYASLQINQSGPTGAGSVYVANSNSKPGTANAGTAVKSAATTTKSGNVTMYWWVDINPGYNVSLSGKVTGGPYSAASASGNVSCAASGTANGTQAYTATATFVAVSVDEVNNSTSNTSLALDPTNPSTDYPFTVTFATSNLKTIAIDLDKSPETADGNFTITSWALSGTDVVATGKFNGGGSYGGASRNNSTTVSLQSKASGSTAKTCTITANFPAMAFVSASADEVYATQGESDKTGSATFKYNYAAEDDFPTDPTLTPVSGTGAFTVTGYTVTPNFSDGTCEVTVDYTFDTQDGTGDTEVTLTLTAVNGDVRTVTLAGHSEAAATDDAKVIAADGTTLIYQGDWVTALSKANTAANAGCTLQLLRNVHLNDLGLTSTQGITNTFTLDLNGKTLSGAINGSILNPTSAGKTLTIKDSKTGGKIQNISNYNGVLYAINLSAGTLNVESGYIYVENQSQYAYGTSSYTDGTTNISSMQARAIHMAAASTVNVSGGKIHAVCSRNAFGIREESSKANNTTLNITGGEVIGEAPAYAYGIYASGKVNISGGSVTALLNDRTVDGNTTYTANYWNDYTLHRYGYGIQMFAYSNATAANCYFGTLTITGGTINAINVNKTLNSSSAVQSEHTYGIMMYYSMTGAGAGKTAPDGSKVMKASAIGSIENATINVTHAGSTAYGIMAYGSHNSFDNTTTPLQIKNTTINVEAFASAYGVYANVYVNWSSTLTALTGNGGCTAGEFELTNTTINATTTGGAGAYCAWASATSGTVANAKATTGSTSTGNATYYGEYAVAGKITVNSGTYTANAATSSAYAIGSTDRAKCVRNVNGVFANRDAVADPQGALSDNTPTSEAYPELYIHGGNFSATTGTTTAIAVKSGGNTLIDGGTFNAFAGGSTAYGLYVTAGKTVANGVTFPASATTVAYGVYVFAAISDWSLFPYAGEVELNNCNATATARTTTDARGVYVYGLSKVYTQASFDAMKTANNSNYKNYGDYAQVGERSIVGKATINGGTYSATAETTTAYGIVVTSTRVSTNKEAIAYNPLVVRNATVTAKTNTGTTAYGVQLGGGGLVENCTITATAGTTTAFGVRAIDKTTVIKNSTISAKGTDAVYGLEGYVSIDATHGYCWHGEYDLTEAGNTKVTAESTGSSKPAYAIYLKATKRNIASGNFAGDYVIASDATINEGTYIAKINGGTSGYALALDAQQIQGSVVGQSEVLINGGKFNGATAEVGTAGVVGHLQLKGGYYVHNTNLSKYIPEGYEEVPLATDRPEYTEGYRYEVDEAGMHGIDVCQIGSTKYKTLEEALQVVTSGQTIYMIANYIMNTPGDYILPSGTTLLIPYKTGTGAGATTAIGNSAKTNSSGTTPTLFRKLTFGNGVNLTCFGTIETSAEQKCNGQYGACAGMVSGAYGQIHLEEGSHISMEANSRLNCWGYITGKGTINVKKNATVLEDFQLGDWCGGTNASTLNNNSQKVFPITHYFYQNIECPITYRPGSKALGSSHIYASSTVAGQDAVALVGVSGSGALFLMDNNDESADTWVMKDYDETTDQCVWTMNSGATIGNLNINLTASWLSYNFTSANYDLPITTNMTIILNNGEMGLSQNTVFLPGSKLIVNKQGTLAINGINVVAYDVADWTGTTRYYASYSPTWGTTNPRKNIAVQSAEFFLHGKVNIKSNGGLYTTASGANVHSTNEDAGEVIYTTAAQGNKTNYYLQQGGTTRTALTVNPAKLKNGDGSYAESAGTASGKTWTYKNDVWDAWGKDGCFFVNAQDKPHAKPAALVELTSKTPDANKLHHDAATGTRNFVWDENCYWWEVVTEPTAEGYYRSINADNNGKFNYYYYDSGAACWKIKKITITWNINGTNTNYSVGYGTKPEWLGATPTKSSSSSDYVWRWDGWTKGSDATVIANNDLPIVTENTTFTAHFYEKYYEYNVTFKNSDGTILDSRNWRAGTTPSYEGTPTKSPTAAETYEFNGTWSPAITTVTGSATYTAQYTATPRKYTITFLNYDMSELGTAEVVYNGTPSNDTYLAAVAPVTEDPYKPDNSAYSFEFAGWRLQGASSNGFAQVKGDQTYIAQFNQTTKKYKVSFVDEDGETELHYLQLEYGQTPSYIWANPTDRQDVEWNYTFTGWDPSEFAAVEGPQTYTAVYNKTKREYTITWLNDDDSQIDQTSVAYGEVPTHADATKEPDAQYSYVFDAWTPEPVAVTGDATYKATYTSVAAVASVTAGGNTAYYTTFEDAITTANGTSNATVTMLRDVTVESQIELTAAMTIDLNGKTITSTVSAATTGTFYINASGKTITICDNGTGGKIYQEVSCSGYLYGIHLTKGSLAIGSGTVHIKNTANNRAYAIYTDGSASSITVSGSAIVKAESSASPFGLYSSAGNSLTMNGGTFIANGAGSRGIYMKGTTNLTNATITATGSSKAYAIFAVSGNMTINSGTYTTSGANNNLCIFHRSNTITIKGGYFSTSNKLYARDDGYSGTITLQGGYYNNDTELEEKCATNYYVLPNADASYPYKVAEAYYVTFDANGLGTAPESQLIEKGQKASQPTAPTETGYTFGGWYKEAGCTNAWNFASDVVNAATPLYAKWTVNSYEITWLNDDNSLIDKTNVNYGVVPTHADASKAADEDYTYTFNGWTPAPVAVTGVATYKATYTTTPNVASVTAGGNTTYYTTLPAAFTAAKATTNATIKMIQNVELGDGSLTYDGANTCTLDLNGHTISGTSNRLLTINNASANFTITDNSEGKLGTLSMNTSSTAGAAFCVLVENGKLYLEAGTVYLYSNSTGSNAVAVRVNAGGNFTMNEGTAHVKMTQSERVGYSTQALGAITVNGGELRAESANGEAYAMYVTGTMTVNGGKFHVTGATASVAHPSASEPSKLLIKGGYYNTNSGMTSLVAPDKTSWNYSIFALTSGAEYDEGYRFKVVEAYSVTFKDGDNNTIQSGYVEKGQTPSYTGATPTKTEDENYTYTFNDTWSPAIVAVTADAIYTAQFDAVSKETGFYVDIVDVDNSAQTLTLNVTGWASNGWPYYVNGVAYGKNKDAGQAKWREDDRTLIIPYTGDPGDEFTITVRKTSAEGTIASKHTYRIPLEINGGSIPVSGSYPSLYVKGTFNVTENITAENIYVAPGAKLRVIEGKTLTADTVFLRTTPWESAELELAGTIEGQVCYTRIIKKKDQYYQFGLPRSCDISAVRLSDGSTPTYGNGWLLRSYSESSRAHNGTGANIDNWETLNKNAEDTHKTIIGGVGYEMFSNSGYYREYYFPINHTEDVETVDVTRTTDDTKGASQEGWNIVVSPLLHAYTSYPRPEGMTFCWLQEDGSYWQQPVEEVKPAIPFTYQAAQTGRISFEDTSVEIVAAAPRRRVSASEEPVRIQWMHLDIQDENGIGDQTSIYSHPSRYEVSYKTGIDVAKQSLTASRAILYSTHAYGDMAFAGVADSLLEKGIALTVYSPKAQELTITMRENQWLNRMAYVWLVDHETGARTDLLTSAYTFDAASGTTSGRFTIEGVFYAPQIATDLENGELMNDEMVKARKVMIDQKMYIIVNGRMYDANGKMVRSE